MYIHNTYIHIYIHTYWRRTVSQGWGYNLHVMQLPLDYKLPFDYKLNQCLLYLA